MRSTPRILVLFVLMIFSGTIFSCTASKKSAFNNNRLHLLANWMTGSFDSKLQSSQDSNFYNIHLEMVRIWPERNDAVWLYVEQAASWALDKPYRQRVYKVNALGEYRFESAVYTMDKPLRFAGKYAEVNPLGNLNPDSLIERTGCSIFLKYENGFFVGRTNDQDCGSSMSGAKFATSEVKIGEDVLKSWDRGYDGEGRQVWGAKTGPYLFRRK